MQYEKKKKKKKYFNKIIDTEFRLIQNCQQKRVFKINKKIFDTASSICFLFF